MSDQINEPDWQVFRKLHPIAMERFCERVLGEVERLSADTAKSSHARYLAIYKTMSDRGLDLANAFNDFRRSTAVRQLACIQSHDLLTAEEMSRFSPETRKTVDFLLDLWKS